MGLHSLRLFCCCVVLVTASSVGAATLYEYNFDGGSLANTGTASDGDLSSFDTPPAFVASYTDDNGITRNDLFDYSVGDPGKSYHFADIANQNLANFSIGFWALNFDGANPPSDFSSAFMNDDIQLHDRNGNWELHSGNHVFGSVATNVWQFITLTNDGANTRLYVNGVLGNTLGDIGDQFNEIGIGTNRARDNNGRWLGLVDDVFVLDTTLSEQDIVALYQAGIPEPASLALLTLGGLLVAGRRRN